MNFLILGAGGVGTSFAAPLQAAGHGVTLYARGEHALAIQKEGLHIRGVLPQTLKPRLATSIHDLTASYDIALLTVKCQDLKEVLSKLKPVLEKVKILITMQNGIDAEEICASVLPDANIVAGVAYVDALITAPGVVDIMSPLRCTLGNWNGPITNKVKELAEIFEKAGISAKTFDSIRQTKWNKLSWNSVFNPLCLIYEKSVSEVRKNAELMKVAVSLLKEISAVAQAEGIEIDPDSAEKFFAYQDSQGSGNQNTRTSMWADYARGKFTEINYLNGTIVRRGLKYKIPTPINQEIVRKVHERTRQPESSLFFSV